MYRNPGFWRIVIVLLLSACGGGGGGGGGGMGIPGAMLTSISPSRVPAGSPTFTLTINGSGFVAGGTVSWNGSGLGPYTLVSSTQVTIQVPAADVTTAGTMGSIVVSIPTPKTNPSNALAFTVSAFTSSACMLFGPYDFVFTGFDASGPVTIGGNFGVDAGGNVTGEDDFKNTTATRAAEAITGGSCKNDPAIANQGTLTLTTAAGTSTYSFVTQASAPSGKGRLAATSGPNGLLGSGRFAFAPPSGFFSGDYAFAMTGGDGSGGQMSLAGRFTDSNNNQFNTPGTLSGGVGDINDAGAVSAGVAITGTVGVPDAFGRSAATFHLGPNTTFQIAFYVLSSSGGFAVDVDSGAGTPVLGGLVSVQANPGLYSNGYLAAPVVLSTWGTAAGPPATSVTSVGLLTPGIGPASGTFTLVLDQMISGAPNLNQSLAGGSYSIAANGRATMSFKSGATTYNYVLYLDNFNDGYIVAASGPTADFGFFEAQVNSVLGNGTLAAGTWFPPESGSPNTTVQLAFNNGAITGTSSAGALTGNYLVTAGRGTATLNQPVFGSLGVVFYVIGAGSVEIMGSDSGTTADAIAFLHS